MDTRSVLALVAVAVVAVVFVTSVSRVIIAYINKQPEQSALPSDLAERLARIEQIVETTALEVERVSEAQRFTARVASERAPGALPPAGGGRVEKPS